MKDLWFRLWKNQPYLCTGVVGIALIAMPFIIWANLSAVCDALPSVDQFLSPLLGTTFFRVSISVVSTIGLTVLIVAALFEYVLDRSDKS